MKVRVPRARAFEVALKARQIDIEEKRLAVQRQELELQRSIQGPMGAPGTDGATGPQGVDGARGEVGPIGPVGLTGAPGTDGAPGLDGKDGRRGMEGPKGEKGDTGPVGPEGKKGPKGDKGDKGEKGEPGSSGTGGHVFSGAAYFGLADATPKPNGVAAAGVSPDASRADHVHASQTQDLSAYETSAHAASTYQTVALAETATHAASTYVAKAGDTLTGALTGTEYRIGTPIGIATAKVRIAASSPILYLEDTSVSSGGVSNAGLFFGNLATPYSWVLNGLAGTSVNDSKEFRLGDGNTVHWSARVPAGGNNNSRLFFGAFGATVSTDGAFNFKHLLNPGTGVGNDVSTLVIKGDTGAANHGGKILDLQTNAGVSVASVTLAGAASFSSTVAASNLSGTNTGDVTIGTANGLSVAGQAVSLANVIAAGTSGAMTGSDKTKLDAITGTHTGTNTGDITLAAVGSAPNGNAATLTGQVLNLEAASATQPGIITTSAQTLGAGTKTFSGAVTLGGILTLPSLSAIVFGSGGANASVTNGAGQYTGFCRTLPNGSAWPVPATVFHTATTGANGTTVETTLGSYRANQFGNDADLAGRGWKMTAFGTFAANTNTKTIKVKFGPTQTDVTAGAFTGTATTNGGGWFIECIILRSSGVGAQICNANWGTTSATPLNVMGKVTTAAEALGTLDWNLIVTGQSGTASSDITLTAMRVEYLP